MRLRRAGVSNAAQPKLRWSRKCGHSMALCCNSLLSASETQVAPQEQSVKLYSERQ